MVQLLGMGVVKARYFYYKKPQKAHKTQKAQKRTPLFCA